MDSVVALYCETPMTDPRAYEILSRTSCTGFCSVAMEISQGSAWDAYLPYRELIRISPLYSSNLDNARGSMKASLEAVSGRTLYCHLCLPGSSKGRSPMGSLHLPCLCFPTHSVHRFLTWLGMHFDYCD